MHVKRMILPVCLALGLAALGRPAAADLTFHVSFDTSLLNPALIYYTEFSLSDGHVVSLGTPDTNNTAVISNFNFGGGAAGAVLPPTIGNASGSTTTSVTLADGDPTGVADYAQGFTPGNTLSFDVTTTTNADAGGIPDTFSFYLLDNSIPNPQYLTTNAPVDTPNAFLRLDITGTGVTITDVGSYGGPDVSAPAISAPASPTPEPGTVALGISVAFGGSLVALRRRRARKR